MSQAQVITEPATGEPALFHAIVPHVNDDSKDDVNGEHGSFVPTVF